MITSRAEAVIMCGSRGVQSWQQLFVLLSHLLGLCLLVPDSGGSISSSEESGEEARVVLSKRCSCWDRY